jgi:hypothetical protein
MMSRSVFLSNVKIGALSGDLAHAVPLEGEAMGVVDETVEDGVGDGGIDDLMPVLDRYLAGDDGRSALVAIVDDLEEVATSLAGQRSQRQSSRISRSTLDSVLRSRAYRPSPRAWTRASKSLGRRW